MKCIQIFLARCGQFFLQINTIRKNYVVSGEFNKLKDGFVESYKFEINTYLKLIYFNKMTSKIFQFEVYVKI